MGSNARHPDLIPSASVQPYPDRLAPHRAGRRRLPVTERERTRTAMYYSVEAQDGFLDLLTATGC
jgi:hypothetical protein